MADSSIVGTHDIDQLGKPERQAQKNTVIAGSKNNLMAKYGKSISYLSR